MTLYVGNQLIRYTKNSGILHGNQPIAKVYKGIQLVYEVLSYDYGETVYEGTNGGTFETTLGKGVYNLYLAGGGGNSAHGMIHYGGSSWVPWSVGGGSGAAWEGQFYNPIKQSFKLYAGKVVESSYMELGGTRMITAGNGTSGAQTGQWMTTGSGGSISVSSTFNTNYKITETVSRNGNGGGNGTTAGGTTVSTLKWGEGNSITTSGAIQSGGAKLVFVRPDR